MINDYFTFVWISNIGYLVEQDLLLGSIGKGVDIGDNDCDDEVDHDEGAEHDQTDQEGHGEHQGQGVLIVGVLNFREISIM